MGTCASRESSNVMRVLPRTPFSDWQDDTGKGKEVPGSHNGIFILFAGWVYILAKKLLEKQGLQMRYTTNLAPVMDCAQPGDVDAHCITIDVADATSDELTWWRALLAPGQGWQARAIQQPPWAISSEGELTFIVATTAQSLKESRLEPPVSSSQAVQFLSRFSARYRLGIQSSAALAMALTLPLLNLSASAAEAKTWPCSPSSNAPASPCQLLQDFDNISKYMTLSSNPRFLSSALWSTFWEPGVDCNLVSPWCDGIIQILEPLITKDFELLAHTLALRRPQLAPFWYGALLFGRTNLTQCLLPFLRTQQAPMPMRPIPEVALWTGSPQSFMDFCGSGPYIQEENTISRADAWRLRHDCWDLESGGLRFRNTPLLGWSPFGFMKTNELEL